MHDDARIYDLESRDFTADLPYWVSLIDEHHSRSVLDLACGTGRITFPLATFGLRNGDAFRIVGLDISQPLLDRAGETLASQPPAIRDSIHFVHGDMRGFDLGEQFDLIIVGFNSFAYVESTEDQLACLEAVRRHLAPNGRFAIDLVVPPLFYLNESQGGAPPMRLDLDFAAPEAGVKRFLRFSTEHYDTAAQRDEMTYYYEIHQLDGQVERRLDDLTWHMYFPRELDLLMRAAGLTVVARYGNYDRAPFKHRSTQYLWVMT